MAIRAELCNNWHHTLEGQDTQYGGTCSLCLQGSLATLHAGFFLGVFFDHEDGGDIFLRNVGLLSTEYTAL
jgi:hypothetical protein